MFNPDQFGTIYGIFLVVLTLSVVVLMLGGLVIALLSRDKRRS